MERFRECRLIVTSTGELVGTTFAAGTNDGGIAFALVPPAVPGDPWKKQVLHNFGSLPGDAVNPTWDYWLTGQSIRGRKRWCKFQRRVFQLTPHPPRSSLDRDRPL